MSVQKLKINGKMHLCVLTNHERNCAARGDHFRVPAERCVIWRPGISNSQQLHTAGILAPPVVY